MLFLSGARPPTEEDQAITEKRLVPAGPGLGPLEASPDSSTLRLTVQEVPDQAQQNRPVEQRPAAKFATSLKLTQEQEDALVNRALRRIDEVKREMGLDVNGFVVPGTWMGIRQRNQDSYDGDLLWRTAIGGIFAKSNFTLGTNKRHVRYLSARIQDDLTGTTPFFAAISKSRNPDKARLAKQVEQYVQDEIDGSQVRNGIRQAQKIALIRNESVVKTTWHEDVTPFRGPATVMVNGFGEPLVTPEHGDYIFEDDNFLPHPAVEGLAILEKDPSFTMRPGQFGFQYFPDLPQKLTLYENVKSEPIDYRCFLCPLRVPSVHEADINVHLYKKDPGELRELYQGIDVSENYFGWWEQTGDQMPKTVHGEFDHQTSDIIRKVTIAECYLRHDADGDGQAEEILLVLDLMNKRPVFYDYLANYFKKRPFGVIPGLEQVPDRWYGVGVYSLGEDQELHIDAEFNRAQVKGSRSSSVTFRQKSAVEEWNNGLPTVIGTDDIYDLNAGYDPKNNPPIFKINLAEENDMALELMEISRQASDALIGAISVKDASLSDMNQSKTATGIMNLQQASDVITKATEQDQTDGINCILDQVVTCVLEHMDKVALLLNRDATELVTLNRNEARGLCRDVKLLLTRSRSTQLLNTSERALMIAKDYRVLSLQDPEGAMLLRPLYIDQLKALEVSESDTLCPEITQDQVARFKMQQQLAAQQQQQLAAGEEQRTQERHAAEMQQLSNDTQGNPQPA